MRDKHTPGPWKAGEREVATGLGFSEYDLLIPITAPGFGLVGYADGTPIDDDEVEANALLLASAPSLAAELARVREALARAADLLEDHAELFEECSESKHDDWNGYRFESDEAACEARAALSPSGAEPAGQDGKGGGE